jgi:hypothetical protein
MELSATSSIDELDNCHDCRVTITLYKREIGRDGGREKRWRERETYRQIENEL